MQWIQHHHYLLSASGPTQNYVEVERDFSDLEPKIQYLLAHPDEAERIADNCVKTFRERYLTVAAEACYWRALFSAYSEVAFEPDPMEEVNTGLKTDASEVQEKRRGTRFETYVFVSFSDRGR